VTRRTKAGASTWFRVARPDSRTRLATKTAAQIVVVWGFALGVLPLVAVHVESRLGIAHCRTRARTRAGIAAFAAGSALGLHAAWVMVDQGRGTPVPFDAARDLVIAGPYRVLRNPMAVGATLQSTGVGLLWGSPLASTIAPAGAVVWNQFIRPAEEDFLAERFGDDYQHYRESVRCWVPILHPYQQDSRAQDGT
jgi:protein-S-isoprenylcysteine O-methyltransferase Ste14